MRRTASPAPAHAIQLVTYYVTNLPLVLVVFVTYYLTNPACVRAAEETPKAWTLDRAVAVALANSPDAKIAQLRIAGAEAMVNQARAMTLPQLSVSGRYTQTDSPMMAFGSILNQRAFNFGLDFNHPGTIDNLDAAATVGVSLYNGGRVSAALKATRAGVSAATLDERATRQQLAAATARAYLDIRKAHEAVGAIEAGVRAYEAGVAAAQARFDAGQMLKADLLSLQVQLAQTRENLLAARNGEALARRAFLFVLGLESGDGDAIELAAEDPSVVALAAPTAGDFSQRPELAGLQERVRAAEAMVRVARGAQQPTVNAFASYQYDHGWKLARGADSWLAGVSVDLSIFDGGTNSGKIRQSQAELAQVREMLRKATLGVALDVEQARLAHKLALDRLDVTSAAVAQAEESESLSRARFEQGALLAADLIGVEGRLIEARMRRAVAVADERAALVDWRRALGLMPVEPSLSQ